MEIIIGCVVGTLVSMALGIWATKKKNGQQESLLAELPESTVETYTIPLDKQLRDAVYDCERHLQRCEQDMDTACRQQLDLIEGVGKRSHVEVANKPLFFAYENPISKEKHFYYTRDLHQDIAPEVLERTAALAQQYQQHIDLLATQQTIFKQLILSHQENLDRLAGFAQQKGQLGKINTHQEKLAQLKGQQQAEEQAIYDELLLGEIAEEVTHQEECFRQYIQLSSTYQRPLDQVIDEKYQLELNELLIQLEVKDPSTPH